MDLSAIANIASLVTGAASAAFWVKAAVVKSPPAEGLEEKPDGRYWRGIVINGGDLIGTLKAQAKWNSAAAIAAALTVLLQMAANVLAKSCP